jgi:ABC-type antimicrobial peptide transport system permease subunit
VNPLSLLTYYRRHKRQALLLLVLIGSLTLGVFLIVGVLSTSARSAIYSVHHLTRMSRILAGQTLDSSSVTQLRTHPDVAAIVPENGLAISFPSLAILDSRPVLGVTKDDLELVLETCDLRLKEGRLIKPQAAEIMLSEEIVRALGLQIGDVIGHEIEEDFYPTIMTELTLVGILESTPSEAGPNIQIGFVSYEYIEAHEAYQPRLSNLLIIPRPGRRTVVDDVATALIDGVGRNASLRLETFERESEVARQMGKVMNGMYTLADAVVAVSAALVVGMVHRIAIARRLPELALLHAAGYEKHRLIRRLVREIVIITGIGWASGLLLSVACSVLLDATPPATVEPPIDLSSPFPFLFTLPIPVAVIGWVTLDVRRVLNRLDTVAIIERGSLSTEQANCKGQRASGKRQVGKHSRTARSTHDPLSSWTFHLRHRRRSLALLLSTGLMVLGVAFPPFVTAMLFDAAWPLFLSYSSHASIVSPPPTHQAVDPVVLAQIRTHPAVAHVIPVRSLSMATDWVLYEYPLPVYGVHEGDWRTLLDVYDLHIEEGQLPEPQSGQIVLTRALAQNRGLSVGDTLGRPVHERDSIPTELTVAGLLDSTVVGLTERKEYPIPVAPRWAAFVSYEFVEHHERYSTAPMHALVTPVAGHEAEVEAWLEESIASPQVTVETLGTSYRSLNKFRMSLFLFLATIESILAVAAALALAILNTIFVNQRRDEFGILHAVGHGRAGLVARTLRESSGIAGAAWLIGAACCAVLVLGAQTIVYAPRGMTLSLTNVTPWLFTLPIPLSIVAASAGTIAWALSRLDPVAVIERR